MNRMAVTRVRATQGRGQHAQASPPARPNGPAGHQRHPLRRGASAEPAPAPVTSPPVPAAGAPSTADLPTGRPSGSVAASVAAAMANWAGASTYPRRRYGSSGSARARSRSMALTLDYRVPNLPMPMKQPSNMVCWATVATMMASWRDQQTHTLSGYINGLGEPWKTKLANNQGLAAAEAPQLLATMGMQVETTQANFTAERWERMLHDFGPLWVTADNNSKPDIQGIHAHILVGIHGPSDGDPTVDVIDPGVGAEVQMPMSDFVERYQQLAKTHFAGLQIRHWPPNAQRAAQQSLRWAQQASERMARASDGGAGAGVALAALGFEVFRSVVEGERGLKWTKAEMKGTKCPRNDKSFAEKGTYQLRHAEVEDDHSVLGPAPRRQRRCRVRDPLPLQRQLCGDVQIHNISTAPPAPLAGRGLEVYTDIVDSREYERGDVAAVEVTLIYSFSGGGGSAGTYTERLVLFGDGRPVKRDGKWDK